MKQLVFSIIFALNFHLNLISIPGAPLLLHLLFGLRELCEHGGDVEGEDWDGAAGHSGYREGHFLR